MGDIRIKGNGSTMVNGMEVNTPYEDKKAGVKVEDFLQLMIAQLKNQDFMNPVDDTQYVTQLAQFATMQSMQELSDYSKTNYVMGLVGKTVTVASLGIGGAVNKDVGTVSKINFSGDEYTITVNGKDYKLNQIMSVNDPSGTVTDNDLAAANKMVVRYTQTTENSATMKWDVPLTDAEHTTGLTYDVYYIEANGAVNFDDLTQVKKGTLHERGLTSTETTITGLEPGKTYYVNVVVKAPNGSEACYQHSTVATKA